jgi:hypothetical protein
MKSVGMFTQSAYAREHHHGYRHHHHLAANHGTFAEPRRTGSASGGSDSVPAKGIFAFAGASASFDRSATAYRGRDQARPAGDAASCRRGFRPVDEPGRCSGAADCGEHCEAAGVAWVIVNRLPLQRPPNGQIASYECQRLRLIARGRVARMASCAGSTTTPSILRCSSSWRRRLISVAYAQIHWRHDSEAERVGAVCLAARHGRRT